ncbi:MAG TPA: hypothetical protein VE326_08865 [Candidatus Binatia bacterium]|nr:hypothetical protein [Candidatus Binatia bacterium]
MHEYALTHLSDAVLLRDLARIVRDEHLALAKLLSHLAEVDARRLYVPAGRPSMFAYCVEELHFSEDTAYKRIRAARAGRQFPEIFIAIAEGRIHLAAVFLLAPHLTAENVRGLVDAATHRTKAEVEALVASTFSSGQPAWQPSAVIRALPQLAPGRVVSALAPGRVVSALGGLLGSLGQGIAVQEQKSDRSGSDMMPDSSPPTPPVSTSKTPFQTELAPGRVENPAARPEPEWYSVQLTIPKTTHDKIMRLQALLSHSMPSGDIVQVLERAVEIALVQVERRKIGSHRSRADSPAPKPAQNLRGGSGARPAKRSTSQGGGGCSTKSAREQVSVVRRAAPRRYIPAHVRRAVWERDQGQCTFVTHAGHRCSARRFLEFDHVEPVARGGKATVNGLRLRCRAHNQYEAERIFGAEFMKHKREMARVARTSADRQNTANERPDVVREPDCMWEGRSDSRGCMNSPRGELPAQALAGGTKLRDFRNHRPDTRRGGSPGPSGHSLPFKEASWRAVR